MLLRKDDPWPDELPIPDIRNWRVLDQKGDEIGFVETLVVDPPDGEFIALLIGANDRFSSDDVEVEDGVVRVKYSLHRTETKVDRVDDQLSDFEASYRRHFERTYDGERHSFEEVLPAYRWGRETASDADFADRSFESAQEDLRAHYRSENRFLPFEVALDAIEFAYSIVHENRPFVSGAMSREEMQILDETADSRERTQTTGGAMSTTPHGSQ